jgi:hypothetical protein
MVDYRLLGTIQDTTLINPSFLPVKHKKGGWEIHVAARESVVDFKQETGVYKGETATIQTTIWRDKILTGRFPLDVGKWKSWISDETTESQPSVFTEKLVHVDVKAMHLSGEVGPWGPLVDSVEKWIPENSTLQRVIRTGPEDPHLFRNRNGVGVAFSSFQPRVDRTDWENKDAVFQMYLAPLQPLRAGWKETADKDGKVYYYKGQTTTWDAPVDESKVIGHHLGCGWSTLSEKNWMPFSDKNNLLHFVYSVEPHVVIVASPDGDCHQKYSTSYAGFGRTKLAHPGIKIHGSGAATYVEAGTSKTYPDAHYVAMFHYVSMSSEYAHFAYRFAAEPPFDVVQVSEQLPLLAARSGMSDMPAFAGAAGISLVEDLVFVAYGSGDIESRALVMDFDIFDGFFCED